MRNLELRDPNKSEHDRLCMLCADCAVYQIDCLSIIYHWNICKKENKREKRPVAFFSLLTRIAILASFIRINKSGGGHDNTHRCEKRGEEIMK